MMPDGHTSDARIAQGEGDLNLLVARVGCLYVKQGLSPPFALRDAVKHWPGLTQDEIVTVVQKHFADHRRLYTSGSGDGYFHMVEAAVKKAWRDKHPLIERVDDEPASPPRKPAGPRNIYTIGGYADAIDDSEDGGSIGGNGEGDA